MIFMPNRTMYCERVKNKRATVKMRIINNITHDTKQMQFDFRKACAKANLKSQGNRFFYDSVFCINSRLLSMSL